MLIKQNGLTISLVVILICVASLPGCEKADDEGNTKLCIYSPIKGEVFIHKTNCTVLWTLNGCEKVNIDLYKGPDTVIHIVENIVNNGSYSWTVSSGLPEGRNYYFKVTDVSSPELKFDYSEKFGIIPPSEFSSFLDQRDGQVYKTVRIGKQLWMAENFNFVTSEGSSSYANVSANSSSYGRLYTLDAAAGAAPEGWRLPSDDDWKELEAYLGMPASVLDKFGARGTRTGKLLLEGGGIGFDAQLGGYHNNCVNYYAHMLFEAHFLSSSSTINNELIIRVLKTGEGSVARINSICHDMASVRYIAE
jgi:uncharacterized protein (TIGR02145 family)